MTEVRGESWVNRVGRRALLSILIVVAAMFTLLYSSHAQESTPVAVLEATESPTTSSTTASDGADSLDSTVAGVIGAVLGVMSTVTGVVVGEWQTRKRERRIEDQQRQSVRMLLSVELDENLRALEEYRIALEQDARDEERWADDTAYCAFLVAQRPAPVCNRLMWESQAQFVANALSEAEIESTQKTYSELATIASYRDQLRSYLQADERAESTASVSERPLIRRDFPVRAPLLWNKIDVLMTGVSARGNPLRRRPVDLNMISQHR